EGVVFAGAGEVEDLDVLYLTGLPEAGAGGSLGADMRHPFAFNARTGQRLPRHAIVLSPMPVIDEVSPETRTDSRLRLFEQSDLGVYVRMALLRHALSLE